MVEEKKPQPPVGSYYKGDRHHCQFCEGVQWYIGRISAECATPNCGNTIPLAFDDTQPSEPRFISTSSKTAEK